MGQLRVISHSNEPFTNRLEAGVLLAKELKKLSAKTVVVLGIPRGGIVVAAEIARFLKAKLDVVLSRKLGAPGNPELAIGALSENGETFINESLAVQAGADNDYINKEKTRQLSEILRRGSLYRKFYPKVPLTGKTAVITDDGVATGATMQPPLLIARKEGAKRVIAAVPVGSKESLLELAQYADEVIVYRLPDLFYAVGQFYREFPQVTDEEVIGILKQNLMEKKSR